MSWDPDPKSEIEEMFKRLAVPSYAGMIVLRPEARRLAAKKRRGTPDTVNCGWCGVEILMTPGTTSKRTWCSNRCKQRNKNAKKGKAK